MFDNEKLFDTEKLLVKILLIEYTGDKKYSVYRKCLQFRLNKKNVWHTSENDSATKIFRSLKQF